MQVTSVSALCNSTASIKYSIVKKKFNCASGKLYKENLNLISRIILSFNRLKLEEQLNRDSEITSEKINRTSTVIFEKFKLILNIEQSQRERKINLLQHGRTSRIVFHVYQKLCRLQMGYQISKG